jgi:hypothetical protein
MRLAALQSLTACVTLALTALSMVSPQCVQLLIHARRPAMTALPKPLALTLGLGSTAARATLATLVAAQCVRRVQLTHTRLRPGIPRAVQPAQFILARMEPQVSALVRLVNAMLDGQARSVAVASRSVVLGGCAQMILV